MIPTAILRLLSIVSLTGGTFFVFAMTVAILRFPDAYTRLHAGTKGLTIGAGLLLFGAALAAPDPVFGLRILMISVFLMITNPIATQAIARANFRIGIARKNRYHTGIDQVRRRLLEGRTARRRR